MPTNSFVVVERAPAGKSCQKCAEIKDVSPHLADYVIKFFRAPPVYTCRRQLEDAIDISIPPLPQHGDGQ